MSNPQLEVPAQCGVSSVLLSNLQRQSFPETKFVVDGLIPLGQARLSLLIGAPASGKSTLARQLLTCLAAGRPFLGRSVLKGACCLVSCEGTAQSLQTEFAALGYDAEHDSAIHLLFDSGANLGEAKKVIAENPDVVLLVVETLSDFLPKIADGNSTNDVKTALLRFNREITVPFSDRVAVLGLHYTRKRPAQTLAESVLGSSEWRGKADTIIRVRQYSESDSRRIIESENRVGTPIPPTFLEFNPLKQTSSLGLTLAADKRVRKESTNERIEDAIVSYLAANPNVSFERDVLPTLSCNSDMARRIFKNMLRDGLIVRSAGTGKKSSPLLYSVPEIPVGD